MSIYGRVWKVWNDMGKVWKVSTPPCPNAVWKGTQKRIGMLVLPLSRSPLPCRDLFPYLKHPPGRAGATIFVFSRSLNDSLAEEATITADGILFFRNRQQPLCGDPIGQGYKRATHIH